MRVVGPGSPEPLGVTPGPGGINVAVYSAHASALDLCLFDAAGNSEEERIALPERTGGVVHGFVAGVAPGTRYGLRAHGAYDPPAGHRHNPAKLLVDPYARALDRPFVLHPAMFGSGADGASRDDTDSAAFVPKAIVTPHAPVVPARRPRVPWAQTILYELHVRGFTRRHPEVPDALAGTCAGLAHPTALAHLTRLGITTVELMPIAAAIDERHLVEQGLRNYWGYNPAALFVPDPRLAPGGIVELRQCVDALHAVGIEVVLDVVLNHTGEGDARGPTLSLRGLDNATYYRTFAGDRARYVDDTGCGNTLALDRPPVLRLAMDVLRYYAEAAGVDGFRFDLATTLGRRDDGFDPSAPLLQAIAQDPVLRELKLIAEPWDVGPGGHRLGAFPAGWGEWNDRYRDTARRFWRGDPGLAGDLATRLAGSADAFAARSRPPSRSVNFVAAHDGYTLADVVSYETKHNEANGEHNRDGSNANFSWNHGVEGPAPDVAVRDARGRDVRNLLAILFLSRGTPMLAMGDELGRTQRGNNNGYAQDNGLTWIDWEGADRALIDFVAALIELRRRHPALRADRWLNGAPVDGSGIADVEWRHPDGRAMNGDDWADADGRHLVAVFYASSDDGAPDDRVAVALNAGDTPIGVRWPDSRNNRVWRQRIDTAWPPGHLATAPIVGDLSTVVGPHSVVVLVEETDAAPARRRGGIEPELVERLARAAGIAGEWWDIGGQRHVVGPETQRALLAAMGLAADSSADARARLVALADVRERRRLPRMVLAPEGSPGEVAIALAGRRRANHAVLRIRGEDGSERTLPCALDDLPANAVMATDGSLVLQRVLRLPPLPAGYYTLTFDDDADSDCRVVAAPGRCFTPPELRSGSRRFGLAAHLYTVRRPQEQGIGDFTTLSLLGEATARAGGSVVGINPLHALFAEDRERASPYHPSDRRFLDPIYIDVERVADLAAAPDARALFERKRGEFARLSALANVDYTAVWQAKRAVLDACFARFEQRSDTDRLRIEFERFVAAGGVPLRNFGLFEALAGERPRESWQHWPREFDGPNAPGIAAFAHGRARQVRFALYLQWLADGQMGVAAQQTRASGLTPGFFRDLAVGAAPDGAEPWANPGVFARGASIGAPPDPFSPLGQNWNLPPPNPEAMARRACAHFRDLLAANMRHAGALRIDHVMGLSRLFWIPDGAVAAEGAYVGYPLDALLAVLAIESARAGCLVVGEDLGTVPEGFRERLAATGVLSYRVLWFERDNAGFAAPSGYPVDAAACVSTHDLPTVAGWWNGADIDEKQSLQLLTPDLASAARAERSTDKAALVEAIDRAGLTPGGPISAMAAHDAAITAAIHRFVCASTSALALIQADDLAGATMAVNLPGTDRVRPNWRRRLDVDAEGIWQTDAAIRTIAGCTPARSRH